MEQVKDDDVIEQLCEFIEVVSFIHNKAFCLAVVGTYILLQVQVGGRICSHFIWELEQALFVGLEHLFLELVHRFKSKKEAVPE